MAISTVLGEIQILIKKRKIDLALEKIDGARNVYGSHKSLDINKSTCYALSGDLNKAIKVLELGDFSGSNDELFCRAKSKLYFLNDTRDILFSFIILLG